MIVVTADGTVQSIGFQTENERTQISMPLSEIADIVTAYPDGTYTLAYKRQNDCGFLVHEDFTVNNGNMIITVGAPMLAVKGIVELQATYTSGTKVASTSVYKFRVRRAIINGETMPTTFVDLLSSALVALDATAKRAEAAKDDAEAAAREAESWSIHTPIIGDNGNWYVWNQENEEYVDTGLPSHGEDGEDGEDGFSPVVTITAIAGGIRITITDKTGDHTADVMDGQDGEDGQDGNDGYSPTVAITTITGGHCITITDKNGEHSANVMDGQNGQDGQDGQDGTDGIGIKSITKTGTSGNVDTYTILMTDNVTSYTFTVTNGNAVIDDTAGAGDTTKVWSASKSAAVQSSQDEEIENLNSAINSAPTEVSGAELLEEEVTETELLVKLFGTLTELPTDETLEEIRLELVDEVEWLEVIRHEIGERLEEAV